MSQCKSCGASVLWVKTINGKDMPLDFGPVEKGNIALIEGVAHVLGPAKQNDPNFHPGTRYQSHFQSCPNAKEHRRKS